jgi:isochorismate synthase
VQRIRAGELEKIVLAREVAVHAPSDHDPAAVFGVLRDAFRSCYVLCAGTGDGAAFVAASPELLVRREGSRASTVALAGSTRRSADPAVDAHLAEALLRSEKDREEQAIVARRIVRALRPHAVWVAAPEEPEVVRVANIQHLATPIRAQLTSPLSAVELAGLLHPTPAVGGEPHAAAAPRIPALEGLDRGWYAGAIGWTDANEDGELCVGLRCALLRGREARLYAGVGVVRDSDPAAELAETEVKLGALLPVLSG